MLVDAYSQRIFNLAYHFSGSREEAEDMTQEIFLKLYTALAKYDFSKNFDAWLMTLARNHLIDQYRRTKWEKKSRDALDEFSLAAEPRSGPEERILSREIQTIIWEGFNHLSPDIRLALILRDIQGKKYDEIAEIMALPLGTVKSRINRGRLQLAKILKQRKEQGHGL